MLAIPDEHLLKFNACKDAKSLWEAIKNREKNRDALTRNAPVDTSTINALVVQDWICGYDWSFQAKEELTNFALTAHTSQGLESLEARIVVHEKNEVVYEEDISFLKYDVEVKDISIKDLKNQLENDLKEKDDLKLKLEKFETSSKNLTKLINSQISIVDKIGLGYDGQTNESDVNKCEVLNNVVDSYESDGDDYQESNSKDEYLFEPKEVKKIVKPSLENIEFVNARNTTVENENKAEIPRKFRQSPRGRERTQRNEFESIFGQEKGANGNKTFTPVSTTRSTYVYLGGSILVNVVTLPNVDLPTDPLLPDLEDTTDIGILSGAYYDEVKGAKADFNNLELTTVFSPIPTTRIHKDRPKEQIIWDPLSSL
nr:hypothetical protein [Tanacetum cinerariifolium]